MYNKWMRLISLCIIPIIVGGILYLAYRRNTLLMFTWFKNIGLSECINQLRHFASQHPLPEWFVFSLPNGLWALSFVSYVMIFAGSNRTLKYICMFIAVNIILDFEILQGFKIISGTFDIVDLATNIIFIYIGIILNHKGGHIHVKQN